MQKHNLEEYFNRRISGHKEFIDKDELWESLNLEKEKKPFLFWWTWSGLSILGIIVLFYLINQGVFTNQKHVQDFVEAAPSEITSKLIEDKTTVKNLYKTDAIINDGGPGQMVKDSEANRSASQKAFDEKPVLHTKESEQSKLLVRSPNESISIFTNTDNTNALDQRISVHNVMNVNTEVSDNSVLANYSRTLPVLEQSFAFKSGTETFSIPTLKRGKILPLKMQTRVLHFDLLPALVIRPMASRLLSPMWSFGISTDFAIMKRSLAVLASGNDEANIQVPLRVEAETPLERLSSGMYLKYAFGNGIYVKLGLGYAVLNSRLKATVYSNEDIVLDSIPRTIIIREEGDTLFSNFGHGVQTRIYRGEYVIYNKHELITIPITVGYAITHNNWSFFGELSPELSVYHSFSGRIYDGIDLIQANNFDAASKISVSGAFGMSYHLNERYSFWMSSYYQKTFNSFTKASSGQSEKYSFIGIKAGAEMRF